MGVLGCGVYKCEPVPQFAGKPGVFILGAGECVQFPEKVPNNRPVVPECIFVLIRELIEAVVHDGEVSVSQSIHRIL